MVDGAYDPSVKFPEHETVSGYTGFLLRKVSTASFEAFAEIVGEYGLHPMHLGMLMIIDADEPVSQQELSARTGIDPSTMVARMDTLSERGLVERARSAEDRRIYEIRLSPAGRKLLAELRVKARQHGERFYAPLSTDERAQLHALLAKLAAGLDGAERG
jgi:DNA-binding MarR family transcriptional regulator